MNICYNIIRPGVSLESTEGKVYAVFERTFFLIKPDGMRYFVPIVQLLDGVIHRIEDANKGVLTDQQVEKLYHGHVGLSHYPEMKRYLQSEPTWRLLLEGEGVIQAVCALTGATRPWEAGPTTIRWMYSEDHSPDDLIDGNVRNAIHCSDGPESAEREIGIFFPNRV